MTKNLSRLGTLCVTSMLFLGIVESFRSTAPGEKEKLASLKIVHAADGNSGAPTSVLAATPPLGWNSWDGYGTTVNEDQVKANAAWFAEHLKSFGWEYVVIDMEWFVTNPTAEGNSKNSLYALDANGRYIPAERRFPSSAGGK